MPRRHYVYICGREVPESVVVLLVGSIGALLAIVLINLFN